MKEKKKRPKYNIKPQEILTEKEAEELISFLNAKHGNQAAFAREIGKSTVAVSGWVKTKQFPKYCSLFLEKLKMKELLK